MSNTETLNKLSLVGQVALQQEHGKAKKGSDAPTLKPFVERCRGT